MYTMMENQTDQQLEHPANGYTAPLDLHKHNVEASRELGNDEGAVENHEQEQSESPQQPQFAAESPPEASGYNTTESEAQQDKKQSGSDDKSSKTITIPPQPRLSVEEFLTELVHAYPHLDLTSLTTKDVQVMMRHEMTLDKERFGLVPIAEYEATRRPKPVPRAPTNYSNPYQNVKNSASHQQMAYSNMQQNYTTQAATAQSQMNASQSANPYANIDPAVLSNWYNEMLKTGYPQEQLQAYFSDMLVKMTQGQAAMQQQQQQQQTQQQQQWAASTVANTYAAASTSASTTAALSYAASTSAQQPPTSVAYSSQAASYNHKSASPYDARAATQDSAAYDAQKLAALQHYANYQGTAAAMAQQSAGYPQTALDMSTWQQQQAGGNADLSLQYGAQDDQQPSQQHQGYM